MRPILAALLSLSLIAGSAEAQKNCSKGKPCGNTCIARDKICRVGSPPSPPPIATRAPTAIPRRDSTAHDSTAAAIRDSLARPWVASSRGQVYYVATCSGAKQLIPANRLYFKTEADAVAAGYRRSGTRGC